MMLGGTIPWLGRGLVPGLWLALIGWLLHGAAAASYSQVLISDLLQGVPVSRLMQPGPPSIDPDLSVAKLVDDFFMSTAERAFPVAVDERLLGIVTMEDIRKLPREQWPSTLVRDIMTAAPALVVVTPDESVAAALSKLTQR